MVTKVICDKCGKELLDDQYWKVHTRNDLSNKDFCSKCFVDNYEKILGESKFCEWGDKDNEYY